MNSHHCFRIGRKRGYLHSNSEGALIGYKSWLLNWHGSGLGYATDVNILTLRHPHLVLAGFKAI